MSPVYDEDYPAHAPPPKSPIPAAIFTSIVTTVAVFFGLRLVEAHFFPPAPPATRQAVSPAAVSPEGENKEKQEKPPAAASTKAPSGVPQLAGLSIEEANRTLQAAGYVPGLQKKEPSQTVAAGRVIRSEPPAASALPAGRTVTLVLADKQPVVPDLTGTKLRQAKKMLEEAGLEVGKTRYRYDERYGGYVVLDQKPEAGEAAPSGGAIDLTVNEPDW